MTSIPLWKGPIPDFDPAAQTPNRLDIYLADTQHPAPAVVICPGGGYINRALHEGEPIARFYNRAGFHAFVVQYRVVPNSHPAPLCDAQRAIRLVRANAAAWGVDPGKIVICGFSAGGHLAASTAVMPDAAAVGDEYDGISCRPDGAILCYPVISGLPEHGHVDTHKNLLGDRYETLCGELSVQNCVTADTPPCFLWHTDEDACVPVNHSVLMAQALHDAGVPYEMHIFPKGRHGVGLGQDIPGVSQWASLSADWIRRL